MGEKKGFSERFIAEPVEGVVQSVARYTKFVLFSKMTLALLAVGMIATVIILPLLTTDHEELRIAFTEIGESEQAIPVMNNPEFQGVDENNQPYTIISDEALQPDEDTIIMKKLEADFFTDDQSWLALKATQGTLNSKDETLMLAGDVQLFHDDGYEAYTQEALIDMRGNNVKGGKPITIKGLLGDLQANTFSIEGKGARMVFAGAVKMKIAMDTP